MTSRDVAEMLAVLGVLALVVAGVLTLIDQWDAILRETSAAGLIAIAGGLCLAVAFVIWPDDSGKYR